jgi:hypothetical protein
MGGSSGQKNALMEQNGKVFMHRNYKPMESKIINILSRII